MDVFANGLLKTRPEQAVVIVEIAGELGLDGAFFGFSLEVVETWLADGETFEV